MFTTRHQADVARRLAAMVLGITVLASCAGSDESSTDATSIETTSTTEVVDGVDVASTGLSYTVESGDTLSGIAQRSGISLTDLVDANGWTDGSDHLIRPGDVILLPQGAAVPTPNQPVTSTPDQPAAAPSGGYEPSQAPNPVSLGANEKSDPIVTPLPDGEYWSWDYTSDGATVTFTLVQYFTGDACRQQFGDDVDACASDNNTLFEPSTTVQLAETAATSVVTCCNDSGEFAHYRVSSSEFARLVAGLTPSADAPPDYAYSRNGVVVTVRDGEAVAAEQIFTS